MTLMESIRTCLQKYADFGGRAQLLEFWLFVVFLIISWCIVGITGLIIGAIIADHALWFVAMIPMLVAFLLPLLAVSVRRLHDTGRSAWWLLLLLIPVLGTIPLLVFFALPGAVGPNRYGEILNDPKRRDLSTVGPEGKGHWASFIRWLLLRYHRRPLAAIAASLLCVTAVVFWCYWGLVIPSLAPPPPYIVGHKIVIKWGRDTAAVSWSAVEGATHYKVFQVGKILPFDGEVKARGYPVYRYRDDSPNTGPGWFSGFSTTRYRVKSCYWFACSGYSNMVTVH